MIEYDKSKYKIRKWYHPLMLHWIINPGLAINDLILGQRVPKIYLIELDSKKSMVEKTMVPCPHCGSLHPSLKWSNFNGLAFKNWFGLYCDQCGNTIPVLTNLTSLILLVISFPLWIGFKKKWREKWLKNQPHRYQNIDLINIQNPYVGKGWLKEGLNYGFWMFIWMSVFFPLISDEPITLRNTLISIPFWIIGGLGFGYTMKLIYGKTRQQKV
jgi:ssDNA-binding Zn-finger/Zn-ribbon topoisomerase 1